MEEKIRNLSDEKAAQLIVQVIDILQENGVSQVSVGEKINFEQLSKIRKYSKYRSKSSGYIAGRDMRDILTEICDIYGFSYNPEDDMMVSSPNDKEGNDSQIDERYLFYYYENRAAQVVVGLLSFRKHRQVKLEIVNDQGERISVWTGRYSRSNSLMFCELEKKDDHGHLKGIHTYYIGNTTTWRSYYVGTFSGIKPDGSLVVGQSVLTRYPEPFKSIKDILKPVDYRIQHFLSSKSFRVKSFLPQSLNELVKDNTMEFFEGVYSFFYNGSDRECNHAKLHIEAGGEAKLITTTDEYCGSYSIIGRRTLQIELVEKDSHNEAVGAKVFMHFNIYRRESKPKIYTGVSIGRSISSSISFAFPCVIVCPEIQTLDEKFKRIISEILSGELARKKISNTIFSLEFDELEELLEKYN